MLRDPVLSQIVEGYSKGMASVSTPLSSYEIQQIYSPFYINYQGLTPYLSTSPSLPFFMNSSFSAFDSYNSNLFIRPSTGGPINDRKDDHQWKCPKFKFKYTTTINDWHKISFKLLIWYPFVTFNLSYNFFKNDVSGFFISVTYLFQTNWSMIQLQSVAIYDSLRYVLL